MNFVEISVRSVSPSSNSTERPSSPRVTVCGRASGRTSPFARAPGSTPPRRETLGVEVGAELAVEDGEEVPDQRRREPLLVVVGGDDPLYVLQEVEAEEERAVVAQHRGDRGEQHGAILRVEPADRRAEGDDEGALVGPGSPVSKSPTTPMISSSG